MRFSSVVFGLPYLLIKLFYIGVPVVQEDGRSGGRTRLVIIVCCKAMYSPYSIQRSNDVYFYP